MQPDGALAQRGLDPAAGGRRVGHGLDRREGLGSDDEERRRRIEVLQRVGDVRAIDVRHEMAARAVMVGRKRQRRHGRSEIGPADADVDDIREAPSGRALRLPAAHGPGKLRHRGQHVEHVRHDVAPFLHDRLPRTVPQREMEDRAVLGAVDPGAGEHGVAPGLHSRHVGQPVEKRHGPVVDGAFGPVEQQIVQAGRKAAETIGIAREGGAHVAVGDPCIPQFFEGWGDRFPVHSWRPCSRSGLPRSR
jgi:hypothetical protein